MNIIQKDLAEQLECTQGAYSKMENGIIPTPVDTAYKIAEIINDGLTRNGLKPLSIESIFFNNEVPNMQRKE